MPTTLGAMFQIAVFIGAIYVFWMVFKWLETIAKEMVRTRTILSILHDRELAEHAQQLRALAMEPHTQDRQKLIDRAAMIENDLRLV